MCEAQEFWSFTHPASHLVQRIASADVAYSFDTALLIVGSAAVMRVRLSVQRHDLPETKVIWPISKDTNTISEFLEAVNNVIPLESDGWGLDDYVVEIGGFECLHYASVHKLIQDNDELM